MKKFILLVFLVTFSMLNAEKKLNFYMDFAGFNNTGSDKILVETYIAVPKNVLTYDKDLKNSFSIELKVFKNGKNIIRDYWGQKVTAKNENDTKSISMIPALSTMLLKPGTYGIKVTLTDLNSKESSTLEVLEKTGKFKIDSIARNKPDFSSIELASKIISAKKEKSEYVKNGVIVIPNPRKIFGTLMPFLYYYTELYALTVGESYDIHWSVTNSKGEIIKEGKPETKEAKSAIMIIANRIKAHNLKSGAYNFVLQAFQKGKLVAEKTNNFFVYRELDFKKKKMAGGLNNNDAIEILNDKQVEKEFKMVYNILEPADKRIADKLNKAGLREFLKSYWNKREKVLPGIRSMFYSMVAKANNVYSNSNKEGWESDRGRVLIKLGKPDHKDVFTLEKGQIDHEVWEYYNQNYTFVFADMHSLGDFKLIHSNYPGEKYDEDWQDRVKKK